MEGINIGQIIKSSTQIYDTWLDNVDTVARNSFELGRQSLSGEQSDTNQFYSGIKEACDGISQSLKDTPFKGIGKIDPVLKESIDIFSSDENAILSASRAFSCYNINLVKKSVAAGNEVTGAMTKMMTGTPVDENTFSRMTNACMDLYEHALNIFAIPQQAFSQTPEEEKEETTVSIAINTTRSQPTRIKKSETEHNHTRKAAA
ncbi:hypothetical protein QUF76_04120 [Desulfobacterales bacterium HSG16]|nr:hypothetical protein [Desulfobacterales bacterium HSG16]